MGRVDPTISHSGFAAAGDSTLRNLRRILVLRGILVSAWLLAIAIARFLLGLDVPFAPLLAVIAAWLLCSLPAWHRLRKGGDCNAHGFLRQILLDMLMLSLLLYYTGGATNPFSLLLLLPLIVAAALLPVGFGWLVAGGTVLCYTALLLFHHPFRLGGGGTGENFSLHVLGMWSGFVFAALLIGAFVVRMGETLRERERVLAQAREQALRDERMVALGALAAGTAHELATPLNTIAMLTRELEEEAGNDRKLRERLRMLQSQVARCKQTLARLSASAGQSRAEAGYGLALDRYLSGLVQQWQDMRPGVIVRCHWEGDVPPPVILAEQTLSQALISILNNAADASPREVDFTAHWDREILDLMVCDRGEGLTPKARVAAGRRPLTTKGGGGGLGLGLYLAHGVIERLGGGVRLRDREGGGVCVHVELPLQRLVVRDDVTG